MTQTDSSYGGVLSLRALVLMCLAAGLGALYLLVGHWSLMVVTLVTFVTDGGLAVLVFIAAGGYGDVIVRPLVGEDCPAGLRVATACGVGLWVLGTAVLVVGSLTHGLLTGWVWWPVVGVGLVIAAWRGRGSLEDHKLPREVQGRSLIWVLLAVAVAVWITGATRPSGLVGTLGADEYDVVQYHLQVPREHYDAGHVAPLRHNVYSYFPMGVEMLYLLSMSLRGGSYEGMYAAKLIHGLFAAVAVLAIVSCFRKDEVRGWASGLLLATMPFVCYLSWLGMVELAEVLYLTLALLWLRRWVGDKSLRSAACVGMAMGCACAVKYLSVGFVVLPVVAMMTLLSLARPQTTWHVAVAAGVAGVLLSPWLIRNAATVGNPVFPLATSVFGSGDHWSTGSQERSAELQQRWVDGHAPDTRPPVPAPPGWKEPPSSSRLKLLYRNFLALDKFGPVCLVLAGIALCMLAAAKGGVDPWEWSLVGTAAVQLAVWVWGTHGMPPRFLVPVIVPVVLLAGWTLDRVYQLRTGPFARKTDASGRPWGVVAAGVLLLVAAGTNTLASLGRAANTRKVLGRMGLSPTNGVPAWEVADMWRDLYGLPAESRPMLVGEARAFYLPSGTVYATAFDSHPLAEMIDSGMSAGEVLADLQARGVTHLHVNWAEIIRLGLTYGCPASLAGEPLALLPEGYRMYVGHPLVRALKDQPRLAILEEMKALGLEEIPAELPGLSAPEDADSDGDAADVDADSPTPDEQDDADDSDAAATPGEDAAPADDDQPPQPPRPQIQLITLYAVPPPGEAESP